MKPSRSNPTLRNILAIIVFILITTWLIRSGLRSLHPQINSIPAVFSGDTVVIEGKDFGSSGVLILSYP